MSSTVSREIFISSGQFDKALRSGAMSVLELAPLAARLGVQGIEYREVYWKEKAKELPEVRDQLRRLGLKATYATFTTLYHQDPAQQQLLLQDLEDAHALGSPMMRVFRGERPSDGPEGASMREAGLALVHQAARHGMRLALENYGRVPGNRPEQVKEVLERLNSPVLGTNVDVENYFVNQVDPLQAIRELSPWIIFSHLKDAIQTGEGFKPTYLGNGIMPLKEILAALVAGGKNFPLCLEFPTDSDPEGEIVKSMALVANL